MREEVGVVGYKYSPHKRTSKPAIDTVIHFHLHIL